MCSVIYGIDDPCQESIPIKQASTAAYYKKVISYFLNTEAKWNEVAQTGNSTQSKTINKLIKAIKKHETRGTGADSQEDRPFTPDEFKQLLDLIDNDRYRAMLNFQYQVIGRCDDTAHVKKENLNASTEFEGYLTAKITWSKNVADETNSPTQILLPDMNPNTCCYLSLALFLEKWLELGHGAASQ